MVELKAELYRAQQDAKLAQEGLHDEERRDRKKAGIDVADILERRNAGVEARNAKDNLSYKVCHTSLRTKSTAALLLVFLPFCLSAAKYDKADVIQHCGCNTFRTGLVFRCSCNMVADRQGQAQ